MQKKPKKDQTDAVAAAKERSFRETSEDWLRVLRPQLKESTVNKYVNLLKSYVYPALGELPVAAVDRDRLESLCLELLRSGGSKGQGLTAKTVSDTLTVVRSVLRFAGAADPEPAVRLRLPRRRPGPRVLSREEQERLCATLLSHTDRSRAGVLLCLFTGLRIGELCALRWEDISLAEGTLTVRRTVQRLQNQSGSGRRTYLAVTEPKSQCSVRTIPLPDFLREILAEQRVAGTGYFLTDSERCMEPRSMQNRFKRLLRESGLEDINYHALRHTFATRCVELRFDVKSLSEILGHSSVSITMNRYVHPSMELKRENMRRLNALLDPAE